MGRAADSALRVHKLFEAKPIISVPAAANRLGISPPTIRKSIAHLQDLEILRETTGRQRGRLFVYDSYLSILSRGTEPLVR